MMYHFYLASCNSISTCLQLKTMIFFSRDLDTLTRLRNPSDAEIRRGCINLLQSDSYSQATNFNLLDSDGNIVAQKRGAPVRL